MSFGNPATCARFVSAFPKASTGTGANNGLGFKVHGWRNALVQLDLGTLGTAATVDVKIQESDVLGSGYADITGAAFAQQVKATDDDKKFVAEINLTGRKKYLRAVVTVGAAASVVGVNVVLLNPDRSERVWVAQEGSAAVAAPVAETGATAYVFSV